MHGVEQSIREETTTPAAGRAGEEGLDQRSLLLEEKLNEIADALYGDPLVAFRAVRDYADRRIRAIEAERRPDPGGEAAGWTAGEAFATDDLATPALDVGREEYFRRERATYEAARSSLLGCAGHYVVIKGEEVAGVWPTYEEALEGGYGRFGPVTFFVKQIEGGDRPRSSPRAD